MTEKEKDPKEIALEQLKKDLEEQQKKMQATELMIAELKRQSKPAFIERKPVRGFMHVVRAVTKPFAALHHDNDFALNDPKGYLREKLLDQAEDELKRCEEIPNRDHRHAKTTAVRAARLVMTLEDNGDVEDLATKRLIRQLRAEVDRLRPLKSMEQKKEEKETQDKMMQIIDKALDTKPLEEEPVPVTTG